MPFKPMVTFLLSCAGCALLLAASQNRATRSKGQDSSRMSTQGAQIYREHCASCHGIDGRGHGPAASALKHPVPDLTSISQKNEGNFPYQGVRNVIEGIQPLSRAHGSREMPIWGPIFHEVEADQDWGEVRLEAITRYIEAMQQK